MSFDGDRIDVNLYSWNLVSVDIRHWLCLHVGYTVHTILCILFQRTVNLLHC